MSSTVREQLNGLLAVAAVVSSAAVVVVGLGVSVSTLAEKGELVV